MLDNDQDAQLKADWSASTLSAPDTAEKMACEVMWVILCAGRSAQAERTFERKVRNAIQTGRLWWKPSDTFYRGREFNVARGGGSVVFSVNGEEASDMGLALHEMDEAYYSALGLAARSVQAFARI